MASSRQGVQRVVFIGAECTGKTTLAKEIAERLGESWSNEYVRYYANQLDRPLEKSDLEQIAKGQMEWEDQAFAAANRYAIHDTNLLSSILYAEHYFDTHIQWVDTAFEQRVYDHYFLCQPDIPWEPDPGQRESPEARAGLQQKFETILERYQIKYSTVGGALDERVDAVLETVNQKQS